MTANYNGSVDVYGGVNEAGYDRDHPFIVFYATIQCLLIVVGTLGNVLVLVVISFIKKLRTVSNVFIFNLALSDLAVTAFILPFNVIGIVKTHHFFRVNSALCEAVAFVCVTACVASLWSIMAISVNRYVYICKGRYYQRIFSRTKAVIMSVAIWTISALIDLPNFLNWGDNRYDMKTLVCSYDRSANYGWILFFVSTSVLFPGTVIIVCYINILSFVRSQAMKIQAHRLEEPGQRENSSSQTPSPLKMPKRQIQLLKMIFAIFAVFSLCWLPYGVVVLLDFEDRLPQHVHIVVWIIAHASTAVDSIIYGVTNKQFRDGYVVVCHFILKRRVHIGDQSNEASSEAAVAGGQRIQTNHSTLRGAGSAVNADAAMPQVKC